MRYATPEVTSYAETAGEMGIAHATSRHVHGGSLSLPFFFSFRSICFSFSIIFF